MKENLLKKIYYYKYTILILVLFSVSFGFVILNLRSTSQVQDSFSILSLSVSIYGLIISTGIILATLVLAQIKPKELDTLNILQSMVWVIVPSIVFARLWHVASDFDYYNGDLMRIFDTTSGGLSIWGGMLGGTLGIMIFTQLFGFNTKISLNMAVVVLPLGQAIGRLGNFINQELFGPPTDLPWGMFVQPENRPLQYINSEYFHPAFLYEMIGDLLLFVLLLIFVNKLISTKGMFEKLLKVPRDHIAKRLGKSYIVVALYLIGYGLVRFIVEFYRLEEDFFIGLSFNQVVAIAFVLVGSLYILKLKLFNSWKK